MRKLGIAGFNEYLDLMRSDDTGTELNAMLDAISTNKTSFFREPDHFDYLTETIVPTLKTHSDPSRRIRIWSAGCSSGQEPYSIAMHLREAISNFAAWDVKILATDISTEALNTARAATYDSDRVKDVPGMFRSKYFTCVQARPVRRYRIKDTLRQLVHFARLNLMDEWPMNGPFDAIFCRNVMIYFDKPTQAKLVHRFTGLLAAGATLFIGHSESLTGIDHDLRYIQPAVYQRPVQAARENAA